jgi:hypothetical protein
MIYMNILLMISEARKLILLKHLWQITFFRGGDGGGSICNGD